MNSYIPTYEEYDSMRHKHTTVIQTYKDSVYTYIKNKYPHLDEDVIHNRIDELVKERFKDKQVEVVYTNKKTNDREYKNVSLLQLTDHMKSNLITTPTGS